MTIIVGRSYTNKKRKKRLVLQNGKDWTDNRWYVTYCNEKELVKRCLTKSFIYWAEH